MGGDQGEGLVGSWTKADQGMVLWDAGIYRLEGPTTLVVGTASDELVSYRLSLSEDRFEITDSDGCRVVYRRA